MYSSYLQLGVFKNFVLNREIDKIQLLMNNFFLAIQSDPFPLEERFCLSGQAAKIIQDDPMSEVNRVVFALSDLRMIKYLATTIQSSITVKKYIQFTNKVIFYYDDFIIEFHHITPLQIILEKGVYVQEKTTIPANL